MDVGAVFSNYMATKVNKVDRAKKEDDNNGDVAVVFGGQDTVSISFAAQELYEKMRLQKLEDEKAEQEKAQQQQAQRAGSQDIGKLMHTDEELVELEKQAPQTFAQVLKAAEEAVEGAEEEVAASGAHGANGAGGAGGGSDPASKAEELKGKIKALRSQIQQIASSNTAEAVKEGKIGALQAQVEALVTELAEIEASEAVAA